MRRTFSYNIVLLFMAIFFVNNISFSQNAIITGKVKYGNEVLQDATISFGGQTKLTNSNGEFSFSIKTRYLYNNYYSCRLPKNRTKNYR
jgi:hypothetical protein